MRIAILFLLFLSSRFFAFSQIDSLSIYEDKAEILFDDANYSNASDYYSKITGVDSLNPKAFFRLGYCYLQSGETVAQSVEYFGKAHKLYRQNEAVEDAQTALFYKATAYHKSYQFEQAELLYRELIKETSNQELKMRAEEELTAVDNAKDYFYSPQPLQVTRYGILNSRFDDHSPVISVDEEVLMFTSKRPDNVGDLYSETGEPYEDIYVFRKGIHSRPVNIGFPINTEYHDATCGLSPDGNQLFIYRATKRDGGDIFHSRYNGKKWSEPMRLGDNINTKYRETHASLSADGNTLYITSDRKGGYGGFDIYVSQKQTDGSWGPAENLGPEINTHKDEIGPYIHPDGYTLYFSSDGHPGMGGYDVFFSEKKKDGGWYEPENIGFPLNTVEHDVFFVPTADGKGGYYASQKDGSTNIYKAAFLGKPEKRMTLAFGYILDTEVIRDRFEISESSLKGNSYLKPDGTSYPLRYTFSETDQAYKKAHIEGAEVVFSDSLISVPQDASVRLVDISTGNTVMQYKAANYNGKYLLIFEEQKDYKLFFEAEGYVYDAFDLPAEKQKGFCRLNQNAELDDLSAEYLRATRTIGFEVGLTSLNDFAKAELDYLAEFLHQHPDLQVDFSGCDYLVYDSNPDYRRLECEYAKARKEKAMRYVESKGIAPERMHGNTFPVHHTGDTLAYTIFNERQALSEQSRKDDRRRSFNNVKTEANLTEEEILEKYGTVSIEREPFFTQNFLFDINQHTLGAEHEESLSQLAAFLKSDPQLRIRLSGYTDLQGDEKYNYSLSEKRAAFVKSDLIERGADSAQIEVEAKGYENPIAQNKTDDGEFHWEALGYNRRVEISILRESLYSELYIGQIEMPSEYIYKDKTAQLSADNSTYAIGLSVNRNKIDFEDFKEIPDISEKHYSNGKYLYFYGKFSDIELALDEFHKVRSQYPKAFIFVR